MSGPLARLAQASKARWARLAVVWLCAAAHTACTGGSFHQSNALNTTSGTGSNDPGAFVALGPNQYVSKVKTTLTGNVATDDEIAAVSADPCALRGLVTQWSQSTQGRLVLQRFFSDAFQQSLASTLSFTGSTGDGTHTPEGPLLQNMRESFGRTAQALIDEGRPFTETATTTRFMLTTGMMSSLAYNDSSLGTDSGIPVPRQLLANSGWGFTLTGQQGIALSDAADPSSANYMTFSIPNFTASMSGHTSASQLTTCQAADPAFVGQYATYYQPVFLWQNVYDLLVTGSTTYWSPSHFVSGGQGALCSYATTPSLAYSPNDYTDWRMVQVRAPNTGESEDLFFNLTKLRSQSELLLHTPTIGFFTTPAFLAQWSTSLGNSYRVTANQTLITALGFQVDGSDTLALGSPSAVDSAHASQPQCFACHQTLDPLRQFFRHDFSVNYSSQPNAALQALPSTFAFRGVTENGNGVADLAQIVASHPNFAIAWAQKVCAWASSNSCLASDPELVRIADLFQASQFDFPTLLVETMSSPLITYASATATTKQQGAQVTSTARRHQFCNALNARLGLSDVCRETEVVAAAAGSVAGMAATLNADTYSRGVTNVFYVTTPDPFSRSLYENICGQIAVDIIDSGQGAWAQSSDPQGAIEKMVGALMGIPAAQADTPTAILSAHYTGMLAAGASASVALQSTFTTACTSGFVTGIGL